MSVSSREAEPSTQPSDYVHTSAATTTTEDSGEEGSGEEGSGDGEHMENGHAPRGLSRLHLSKSKSPLHDTQVFDVVPTVIIQM